MGRRLRRRLPGPLAALVLRYVEHTVGHRFTEFAPIYTVGRVHAPVLLVHGQRDTTVPLSDAYRLHAQAPENSTLVVLPGAEHNSVEALDGAKPAVLAFISTAGVTGSPDRVGGARFPGSGGAGR
ncbi:MAG TPA: alpha/beta hydrolase [Actinomycetes bacterium]